MYNNTDVIVWLFIIKATVKSEKCLYLAQKHVQGDFLSVLAQLLYLNYTYIKIINFGIV